MQYLKKSDYIKNKQLSLSLLYIFVKMLLNGREIIMREYFLYFCQLVALQLLCIALVGQSVPPQTEQHVM